MSARFLAFICLILWMGVETPLHAQRKKNKDKIAESDYWWGTEDEEFAVGLFNVSIDAGAFFAGKHPANFYNGNPKNVNTIRYVIDNPYWHEEIKQALGNRNFRLGELPAEMKYKVSVPVGVRFAYNININNSVFFQFHSVKLTTSNIFTLEVDSANFISDPALRQGKIWGSERRTVLDLGYRHAEDMSVKRLRYFFEIAVNLTNTKVIENKISIREFEESLIYHGIYVPGQSTDSELGQSAIGFGAMISLGLEYQIHRNFSVELGGLMYLQDINLEGYTKFHPSFGVYVRFNVNNLL